MTVTQLKSILRRSIIDLFNNDFHLLKENLSERSIAHKLANYIQNRIDNPQLSVDVEYNGNVENSDGRRKKIEVLTAELERIGRNHNNEETQILSVFPDIILHQRASNEENLLIIEVKKNYPQKTLNPDFDFLKLQCYTSNDEPGLSYKLGAFVELKTLSDNKEARIQYFISSNQEENILIQLNNSNE